MRHAKPEDVEKFKKERGLETFGMPVFLGAGSHQHKGVEYLFMVMEKFGKDLWKIFIEHNRTLPTSTVFKVAIQMLDILQYIHDRGYVHADIKAENILMGITKDTLNKQIYVVDIGLATKHNIESEFKPNPKRAHDGTIEYLSRDAHKGVQTIRGDLEILAYNIIQWLGCVLPWEKNLKDPNVVHSLKNEHMASVPNFVKACFEKRSPPGPVLDFLNYIVTLDHNSIPDYNILRKIFLAGLDPKDSPGKPLQFSPLSETAIKGKPEARKEPSPKQKPRKRNIVEDEKENVIDNKHDEKQEANPASEDKEPTRSPKRKPERRRIAAEPTEDKKDIIEHNAHDAHDEPMQAEKQEENSASDNEEPATSPTRKRGRKAEVKKKPSPRRKPGRRKIATEPSEDKREIIEDDANDAHDDPMQTEKKEENPALDYEKPTRSPTRRRGKKAEVKEEPSPKRKPGRRKIAEDHSEDKKEIIEDDADDAHNEPMRTEKKEKNPALDYEKLTRSPTRRRGRKAEVKEKPSPKRKPGLRKIAKEPSEDKDEVIEDDVDDAHDEPMQAEKKEKKPALDYEKPTRSPKRRRGRKAEVKKKPSPRRKPGRRKIATEPSEDKREIIEDDADDAHDDPMQTEKNEENPALDYEKPTRSPTRRRGKKAEVKEEPSPKRKPGRRKIAEDHSEDKKEIIEDDADDAHNEPMRTEKKEKNPALDYEKLTRSPTRRRERKAEVKEKPSPKRKPGLRKMAKKPSEDKDEVIEDDVDDAHDEPMQAEKKEKKPALDYEKHTRSPKRRRGRKAEVKEKPSPKRKLGRRKIAKEPSEDKEEVIEDDADDVHDESMRTEKKEETPALYDEDPTRFLPGRRARYNINYREVSDRFIISKPTKKATSSADSHSTGDSKRKQEHGKSKGSKKKPALVEDGYTESMKEIAQKKANISTKRGKKAELVSVVSRNK